MTKATIIRLALGVLIGGGIGAVMGYFGKCASGTCPLTANPYRGAIYGAVLGILFSYGFGGQERSENNQGDLDREGPAEKKETLILEDGSTLQNLIASSDVPVMVDFYSDGCPPCQALAPVIDQLAEEYAGKAVIAKLNIDTAKKTAAKYKITATPSVLIFIGDKEMERIVGTQSLAAYKKIMTHYIERTDS